MSSSRRTVWYAPDLGIDDEPLLVSLLKYRQRKNRYRVRGGLGANLVSSQTGSGTHMPILDMDFPHHIVESSTEGHSHLYIDVEMSKWRWFWLMCALKYAGVIELGFFVWSIRRGANFVRRPGTSKRGARENTKATYGWLFKLKKE